MSRRASDPPSRSADVDAALHEVSPVDGVPDVGIDAYENEPFDTIMPKSLATAAVDRLLHHAHVVLTEGISLRLNEATTGKGVMPLAYPVPPPGDQLSAHRNLRLSVDKRAAERASIDV